MAGSGRTPTDVLVMPHKSLGAFDKFATAVSELVARAWFFALCVLLIVLWAPSILFIRDVNTYQLIVNTFTTIITFLLVALLQNTQHRADKASQQKLNAIADALADLMESHREADPSMLGDVRELRETVGLEKREGT